MRKIALLDVDNTLVSNKTSEFNHILLNELKNNNLDEVWLFSGRTGLETYHNIITSLSNPTKNWHKQLIFSVMTYLEEEYDLNVRGAILPYDHYFNLQSGDGYLEKGLRDIEVLVLGEGEEPSPSIFYKALSENLSNIDEEMALNLILNEDTTKTLQFLHFLKNLFPPSIKEGNNSNSNNNNVKIQFSNKKLHEYYETDDELFHFYPIDSIEKTLISFYDDRTDNLEAVEKQFLSFLELNQSPFEINGVQSKLSDFISLNVYHIQDINSPHLSSPQLVTK